MAKSKRSRAKKEHDPNKPQPDVYVGLLLIAVAALITGCIFLVLELSAYNWEMAPPA